MITAATDVKKRYDAARAWDLTTTALLEEEQLMTAILTKEARAAVAMIKATSPTPPLASASGTASSDNDYEAVIIGNIHVQASSVQNICSLISVTLDLSSAHYARWCHNVLLTVGRYSLSDHVLVDTTYINVPS
jgi:hypothetical protein